MSDGPTTRATNGSIDPKRWRRPKPLPLFDEVLPGGYGTNDGSVGLPPLLKWAGGKTWLLPYLLTLWRSHKHRRLVEPFCGGLAIALGLAPWRAVLNDLNPHVINFYQWVQRSLVAELDMRYDEALYYEYRNRFNALIAADQWESREAAELFYYLNRTGFNGLCRFNSKGEFNVPFGRYTTISYRTDFSDYSRAFSGFQFTNTDFEAVPLQPQDFVFVDPPYDAGFTEFVPGGFSWRDQERLVAWLGRHAGPVVASNRATQRIVTLYERTGFKLTYFDAPRRISSSGDRTPVREVLATRNL